jgi:hypothetical protein
MNESTTQPTTQPALGPEHDDWITEARKKLIEADKMNEQSGDVLASGTGNYGAAETYRKVADILLKQVQAMRRRHTESKAAEGLKAAFPEK